MLRKRELINEQFEIRHRLAGGMGYVYIVFDQVTEKVFAIKTLKDELVEHPVAAQRFEREARNWINLGDHPHVVRAISFFRGDQPLLLLEYIDGPNLDRLLQCEPEGLALGEAVDLAIHLIRGLAHAHNHPMFGGPRGVIHRDFKPGNILITRGRVAKVTDFGLARAQEDTDLTSPSPMLGTMPYMAPEQWVDAHSVTEKADFFSFGTVLYQMVTGRRPFPGVYLELYHRIRDHNPDPIEESRPVADPRLIRLIMHCLAKKPDDRPASAEVILKELLAIQASMMPFESRPPDCRSCGYRARKAYTRCPICGAEPAPETSIGTSSREVPRLCGCGQPARPDDDYCLSCGSRLGPLTYCIQCGQPNPFDHRYCSYCGSRTCSMPGNPSAQS